jgi:SAM-dependent methyltransferase
VSDDSSRDSASRDLVRRGYDAISVRYRSDAGESNADTSETTMTYRSWIDELVALLPPGARVLDIGCGAGVPADRMLADAGFDITGVDISSVQIGRARDLVPRATFVCADIMELTFAPSSLDAVVSLYALIHPPLSDQRELITRGFDALRPGGLFLAIVGHERWTGVEDYLGSPMFWDQAAEGTYLDWLREDGFDILWRRYVPEGSSGHVLVLARRSS